jgi:uncharacterized protein
MASSQQFLEKYGSWAVVTGASDGIGLEIAKCLAEKGMNLVLVARRQDVLEKFASELSKNYKIQTKVIRTDFSEADANKAVFTATRELDVGLLVASAGYGSSGEFITTDLETELSMIDVNCRAVTEACHHFAKRFVKQKRGGIILLSSIVAFQGVPKSTNYAATKAYIQVFAEGLHAELAPHGVDVLASAPATVQTGFAKRANMQMGQTLTAEVVARETVKALGKKVTVRPGFLSYFLGTSLSFLPRWAKTKVMAGVMGGMTKHQPIPTPKAPSQNK